MKFNAVNNKECSLLMPVWWLKHGQPCLHQLHVLTGHSLPLAHGMCIYPHSPPAPFTNPLINQCYRCLVPLLWGLMAERCGFTSHGGVTLSSGWLCQKRKPLDIPRTHIHLETQVVNFSVTDNPLIQDSVALTFITDTSPHAVSCFT